jgi:hypothetical protein
MSKKILTSIVVLAGLTVFVYLLFVKDDKKKPIIIISNASYIGMTLDDLITEADLIVVGNPDTISPSRWNTSDGKLPREVTVHTITPDMVIFTDVNFKVDQIIKGKSEKNIIRIRSLGGSVGEDQMVVSGVASLEIGKTYLLFLGQDIGPTANIDPGYYLVRGGLQGLYEVFDGKAISITNEWQIDELIAYIQKSLLNETSSPMPSPTFVEETPMSSPVPSVEASIETAASSPTPVPAEVLGETPSPTEVPAELGTETPMETPIPVDTPTP